MYLDGTGRRKLTAGQTGWASGRRRPRGRVRARRPRRARHLPPVGRRHGLGGSPTASATTTRRAGAGEIRWRSCAAAAGAAASTRCPAAAAPPRLTRGRGERDQPGLVAHRTNARRLARPRGQARPLSGPLERRRQATAHGRAGDEIEPSWSPDGSRIVFTHRRRGKRRIFLMKVRGKPIRRLPRRSVRVRRIATSGSSPGQPSWQPTGLPPVIAAAGDIACDPESPTSTTATESRAAAGSGTLGPPAAQRPLLDPGARRHPVRGRRAVEVPELLPGELGPDQAPDAPDPGQPRVPRPGRGGLLRLLQRGRPGERPGRRAAPATTASTSAAGT